MSQQIIPTQFNFGDIEFIATTDEHTFQKVLDDFPNAKRICIATYHLYDDSLLNLLRDLREDVAVQIVTAIPDRYETYFGGNGGEKAKLLPRRLNCSQKRTV